ncbi:MAG: serine/threonine protein kinase [Planctomycetaceae bacterium]|nr:serine/threonine protein kinase [Planctomycetaceae bacterium]
MSSDSLHLDTGIFCPGCNEWFPPGATENHCPRCQMPLVAADRVDTLQPTFLWRGSVSTALENSSESPDSDAQRLLRLVGTDLSIYHLESLLGRGGMGWVFLGRHRDLHRHCAVKVLAPRLVDRDPEFLDRFQNEGRAAASLVHPNVITTHAIGQSQSLHFLEMEFVPGRSLQQRINEGPLAPLQALSIASQVAAGLSAAHMTGLLHRDLKPDNILLTHQGIPKISDFGLAKRVVAKGEDGDQTLAGTPHFMAPELFLGEPASMASDVYALGVTLYQMLTGKFPFTRPKLTDLIHAVTHDPLPHLRVEHPHIPLDVAECVFSMLSRSPANRPRDGIEAQQLLAAVLGHARDIESLLHEALDDLPTVRWKAAEQRHEVLVELANERRQKVFIESVESTDGDRLLSIYSLCGPFDDGHCTDALRLNSAITHGALAIRDIDGTPHFVLANNYPRATVDPEEIRRSVLDAALHADAFEQRLTGRDEH